MMTNGIVPAQFLMLLLIIAATTENNHLQELGMNVIINVEFLRLWLRCSKSGVVNASLHCSLRCHGRQ